MSETAQAASEGTGEVSNDSGVSREAVTAPSEDFSVPEQYADRSWAKNIKSMDDMFSQFDNAQSMIGKKSVPSADASAEEWNAFYEQLRPESADGYELSLPEGFEGEVDEKEQAAFKELFHKLGFTPQQGQGLYEGAIAIMNEFAGEQPTPEQIDQEFAGMMEETFGNKAQDAIKTANKYLAAQGEEAIQAMNMLPNEQLKYVISTINNIHNSFAKEDGAPMINDSASGSAPTTAELVRKANELRRSEAMTDPFHKDNAAVRQELEELDKRIQRLVK